MEGIMEVVKWGIANWQGILTILASIYGVLAAIVKICPTLPEGHWLLGLIKLLGKITNDQTDNSAVRTTLIK